MNQQKQDRRVRRTQKLLKDSLIALLREKEFKNISVKDITDHADLNRGTFYLHYTDIYQLLNEIEDEILTDFEHILCSYEWSKDSTSLVGVFTPIVEYVDEHRNVCQILFENNVSSDFLTRFHELIQRTAYDMIKTIFPCDNPLYYDMFFEYAAYGVMGIIRRWIHTPHPVNNAAQLAKLIDRMVVGTGHELLISNAQKPFTV